MEARSVVKFLDQTRWTAMPVDLILAGRIVVAAVIAFVLSAQIAMAGSHPNMYLNQAEIDAIKIKIEANEEPWASAYSQVLSAANSALNAPLLSVTFQGPRPGNKYYTLAAYCGWPPTSQYPNGCRDGQVNPALNRGDYNAAIKLGDSVRDLGLAYVFTGEAQYAEKAIDFIRAWSLDPGTRMTPIPGNRIETYITFPGYFYGADLIWNYEGWNADEKAAFVSWVRAMGDYVKTNGEGNNNFSNWRVVMLASAGALLDESSYLTLAESEWKRLLPVQMNGMGSSRAGVLGQEVGRTRGLHYSMYALNAMVQGAEILRHRNVNLYNYVDDGGRGLVLALDYITPYAINPSLWGGGGSTSSGYKQITTITQKDSMALYELAYSQYQKQSYLDAINRWNRPMDEIRTMGITTLTHANQFDLDLITIPVEPIAPNIQTQPESLTVTEGEDAIFSVVATGSSLLTYQWYFNGVEISGANSTSYMLTAVNAADAGTYGCIVTNDEGSDSCVDATLTVSADVLAPTLVTASATSDTTVDILFSEAVNAVSAETSANYQLNLGISVDAASLNADERSVRLTISPALTEETTYTVSVSNIQDQASSPNTIIGLSTETFTYRTADDFEDGAADGWTPFNGGDNVNVNRWEVVADEGDNAYFLNTTGYSNLDGKRLGEYSLLAAQYGDFTFTAQAKLGDDVGSNTHADYAVLFGFQDNENYYYILFNNDQGSTQIAKIEDGSRVELATAESDWLNDNAYHTIKVSRLGSEITVYFDESWVMNASDSTFGNGLVGVGSYNDSAYFDDVKVVGQATTTPDTTVPVITLTGDDPQTITVGEAYSELGASATDNKDGDISDNITTDAATVNTAVAGAYNVTYNVSDAAGNAAIEVIRIVNVAEVVIDDTAPEITLTGINPQMIIAGNIYTELGATATDNVDGDISGNITMDAAAVNTAIAGSYNVTYNVSDAAGNAAIEVIRIVNVEEVVIDGIVPVITLVGNNPQTITVGNVYADAGATAMDNIDGNLTTSIQTVNLVDTANAGTYEVTYDVSDAAGNAAIQVTRTVSYRCGDYQS
ncbi:MAG: DUF5011 domain-containing protein [Gammaproteobacteria bacterium]|nr:DUF5011 domain-containing protein [Gammaproteobacteria bacterium]